jgi:hypothetical protein
MVTHSIEYVTLQRSSIEITMLHQSGELLRAHDGLEYGFQRLGLNVGELDQTRQSYL